MELEHFQIVDVSEWEVDVEEVSGTDAKEWLLEPGPAKTSWLFKPVTVKNGHVQGEDWAEKVASHLAEALTVPSAEVELAVRGGTTGSISRNLRPEGWELQPGALQMLDRRVEGFQRGSVSGRPGHSVANIRTVLHGVMAPPDARTPDGFTAYDVFSGYLILDALIANRDRHDENWAVLRPSDAAQPQRLCGSYDQAGSLGYNLRDEERTRRLDEADGVRAWAVRGTAWRLDHVNAPLVTLVRAAAEALSLASTSAKDYWLDRLVSMDTRTGERLLARVSGMSDPARKFAAELLDVNRRRLLDECA